MTYVGQAVAGSDSRHGAPAGEQITSAQVGLGLARHPQADSS